MSYTLSPCDGWTYVGAGLELALSVANEWGQLAKELGGLPELACLGLFAKVPNAAKCTQLGQVTSSYVHTS
jgi:hypothetical protein